MRQGLTRLSEWLGALCKIIGGVSLLAMLLVTVADVGLRYLGDVTGGAISLDVSGNVELVSYLLLFSLLAAMAASVEKSQVVVEALTYRMGDRLKSRIQGFYLIGFTFVGFSLCMGLFDSGMSALSSGHVTQTLRISMAPIDFFAAFLGALLGVRSLLHVVLNGIFGQAAENAHG